MEGTLVKPDPLQPYKSFGGVTRKYQLAVAILTITILCTFSGNPISHAVSAHAAT